MDRPPAADLLAVAREAAAAGAEVLLPRFGRERASGSKSSPTDLVSEADLASERAIRDVLAARRPDDGILGEEGTGDVAGSTGLRWVVDPLDGTVNFLYGLPQWCVSVAVEDGEGTLAGVVHDPVRDEAFCATADGEALLDGESLLGSGRAELARALVATGFGYESDVRRAQATVVARLLPVVRDIRRAGSAALDLAWLAAGRYDAYYERGVQHWDVAAGLLVCARAGLEERRLEARDGAPAGVLVAPEPLVEPLLELVGS
jgi:myo-inositol-1(or 4)-monophosphatase